MSVAPMQRLDDSGSPRERLLASEEVLRRTGHYAGIAELRLRREDPLRYERLHQNLLASVIEARETGRRISGSPAVREMGEFLVTLFTVEGDAIALSTGIMLHVHTTSRFIKWMLRHDYERDPGILPGDVFANNDPFIGDVQNADVLDAIPFFHSGRLIGWIGAVSHVPDVGGIEPGGEPSVSSDRFGEGLYICAEKVGADDRFAKTHIIRCERNLRDPALWILDEKAKLSACLEVREKVSEIIDEYGLDYYLEATREFIEEQRRGQLAKVRTSLVPGRYRATAHYAHLMKGQRYIMPQAAVDLLHAIPVELRVQASGKLVLDLEGTPEAAPHSSNCTPTGIGGGLFLALMQLTAYDGKVNHGAWAATELRLPHGSLVDPADEKVGTATGWAVLLPLFGAVARCFARGFYARGFLEEVFLLAANAGFQEWGGRDQYGRRFGGPNFETGANGSGARGFMDGIDTGYALFNPEGDMGSIETWEQQFPILYLGRRNVPDSGGAGRYRGGTSFAPVIKVHGSDDVVLGIKETSGRVFDQTGIFGGYPAPDAHRHFLVRRSDIAERAASDAAPLPHELFGEDGECELVARLDGDVESGHGQLANALLAHEDVIAHSYGSSGGFGDPLERDPEAVARDVGDRAVSRARARDMYGVVVTDGPAPAVDREATELRRRQLRRDRLAHSQPAAEWIAAERERVRNGAFIAPVRELYRSAARISARFDGELKRFWSLGSDWEMRP